MTKEKKSDYYPPLTQKSELSNYKDICTVSGNFEIVEEEEEEEVW